MFDDAFRLRYLHFVKCHQGAGIKLKTEREINLFELALWSEPWNSELRKEIVQSCRDAVDDILLWSMLVHYFYSGK